MKKELKEWLHALASSVIIIVILLVFIQPTLVKGDSMYPTVQEYNYLIIEKISYKFHAPAYGDIVVFRSQIPENAFKNKDLIKRVIGLPGDRLVIRDGKVSRNGKVLVEPYIAQPFTFGDMQLTVPKDNVFLLGDNRAVSRDSRDPEVGFVSYHQIIGRILIRLFPFNQFGSIK